MCITTKWREGELSFPPPPVFQSVCAKLITNETHSGSQAEKTGCGGGPWGAHKCVARVRRRSVEGDGGRSAMVPKQGSGIVSSWAPNKYGGKPAYVFDTALIAVSGQILWPHNQRRTK